MVPIQKLLTQNNTIIGFETPILFHHKITS